MVIKFKSRKNLCLMLLCLCSDRTCVKLKDDRLVLPATYNQTKDLAESVCMELFFEKDVNACQERFLSNTRNTQSPAPEVHLACRSSSSATSQSVGLMVAPLEQMQLITLIGTANSDDQILKYMIVEPDSNYTNIAVSTERYTVWSTVLNDDGSPTLWRRGPEIEPWAVLQQYLENKKYNITYKLLSDTYVDVSHSIDVRFTWNNSEAIDSCFHIIHNCDKKTLGDIYHNKIMPYEDRVAVVMGVPLDDMCTFHVIGLHGNTSLRYPTLSCAEVPGCVPEIEPARNITLKATKDLGDTWSVRVSWLPPAKPPRQYDVTLKAGQLLYNKIIAGNLTEMIFTNVTGAGKYVVLVKAQEPEKAAYNSRDGEFPPRVIIQDKEAVPEGVIYMLSVLALTALTFGVICWRRRFNYKQANLNFANELEKITGDAYTDDSDASRSSDKWEIHSDRLVLHEIIGEGAFGVVRRGTLAPFKDVAVKMLKDLPSVEEIRSFRSEMEMMKSVGAHPHIVSLVGCCSGRRPLILVEYCSRGDLLTFLRCSWDLMTSRLNTKYCNNNNKDDSGRLDQSQSESKLVVNRLYDFQGSDTELTIVDLLSFCRQIAMGMEFLESNRVVHRDLAARNILVTDNRTLKIADFGLSRDVYQENQYKQKGNGKMPVKWMALESLTHRVYTTHSDVWSFGVVMWEVLTVGGAPYAAVSAARLPRLLQAGYRLPRPLNCSPQLYEVMQSCWSARARSRPSFAQLHAALDAQLSARADHYLELAVPDRALACAPNLQSRSYVRTLATSTLSWVRSKSYERPQANSNHYTVQPALARDLTADMKIP